ncbi:MAG: hypothetical protein F4210_01070 [Holophagales bacterium]|nr:hypothetical protein [Holophagales bacterium]MYF94107.1 hypothetical protein [Holophagales bacterium]
MSATEFQPSLEGEARLLLLIEAFSRGAKVLEGRTKLAKLDFLLRYPSYYTRALEIRRPQLADATDEPEPDLESRMVRYRFGPWDPAYYALLGRLIGKRLVRPAPFNRGIGYRATDKGRALAQAMRHEPAWVDTAERTEVLRRHFDLSGAFLKKFIYEHFPEVTKATWGESL